MKYPTLQEVSKADHYRICQWWRFLASPMTDEEKAVIDAIALRYSKGGGMIPEISKSIGLG